MPKLVIVLTGKAEKESDCIDFNSVLLWGLVCLDENMLI
ncbi:hypothetical protein DFQ00_11475 [Paenibacillus barcinonensis]|uniref:Uncharacterized protein n=1 Tax=Paenibacillus barcinonensis TaxID=198119 RepID=A0A2V4W870_PAEBA|nr:hypothetical protein DFQ00_11475 [Paenibacillus barcinonensis]